MRNHLILWKRCYYFLAEGGEEEGMRRRRGCDLMVVA